MRMMMKVQVPTDRGNSAVNDGSMGQTIAATLERTRAEAAYFTVENGQRTAYIFFDLRDVTDMPSIGEPIFQALGATVQSTPCMNADELRAGLEKLARQK